MNQRKQIIKNNSKTTLKILTRYFGGKYSSPLYHLLAKHPDFPSFLSFQYILDKMGKDSIALKTDYDDLLDLPKPLLIHATTNVDLFLFVTNVDVNGIQILHNKGQTEDISRKDFETMWTGNVLLIDAEKVKVNIPFKDRLNSLVDSLKYPFLVISLFLLCICLLVVADSGWSLLRVFYFFFVLFGFIISILLFIEQVDRYNIHIKKLCSNKIGKNVDCSSILDFKDANFLNLVSWSDIGFVYFMFLLIVYFVFSFDISQTLVNLLSLFSFGYVFYSIYYQMFVVKKWCTLCLSVQFVFFSLFTLSALTFDMDKTIEFFEINIILMLVVVFVVILSLYIVLKSLIINGVEQPYLRQKYNDLIYNEDVKRYLFDKSYFVKDLGGIPKIELGNSDADDCLTIIFSPVCSSCIKDLQKLLPIFRGKKNLKIELIFLLDRDRFPESVVIAKCLINNYMSCSQNFIDVFQKYVENYPRSKMSMLDNIANEELECILNAQEKWCLKHSFYNTPILFLNNAVYPHYYTVQDIDYLCN